jgi:hypothetical protein
LAEDPLIRVLEREAHHERVARFAALKPRERRDLLLHAGGYRDHEIAALTQSTYTGVILGRTASTSLCRRAWTSTTCRRWMSAWPVLCYTSAPIGWRS